MSRITNAEEVKRELKRLRKNTNAFLRRNIKMAAEATADGARHDVPVDTGALKESIVETIGPGVDWSVQAEEIYGAYVEFGTGGLVSIPLGWEAIAAQYKGKGIRKINLPARPFLIPNFRKQSELLRQRCERYFSTRNLPDATK